VTRFSFFERYCLERHPEDEWVVGFLHKLEVRDKDGELLEDRSMPLTQEHLAAKQQQRVVRRTDMFSVVVRRTDTGFHAATSGADRDIHECFAVGSGSP
jgi:hypothetical protein